MPDAEAQVRLTLYRDDLLSLAPDTWLQSGLVGVLVQTYFPDPCPRHDIVIASTPLLDLAYNASRYAELRKQARKPAANSMIDPMLDPALREAQNGDAVVHRGDGLDDDEVAGVRLFQSLPSEGGWLLGVFDAGNAHWLTFRTWPHSRSIEIFDSLAHSQPYGIGERLVAVFDRQQNIGPGPWTYTISANVFQ